MGTAGHVDHGKSSLVIALTGIDPDRLPEEKERGLTIDLGFAWLETESGQRVGIVDVPGHERFVKNMIAGVGAIDFVLFVVAADDGWMPQSAEHLAILNFLGVKHGIIVITKTTLATGDWLDLVCEDVRSQVRGSFLADAPLMRVDSISREGIDDLKSAIGRMVESLPPRADIGCPRLYIDRAFAIAGRGSVVTGTLIDGTLSAGQAAVIVPDAIKCRVRELQNHGRKVDRIAPGQRVAANLAGVEVGQLRRGQCLVSPENDTTADRLWADIHILADATHPLKAERRVRVMVGTAEPEGTAFPLDSAGIPPGGSGLCELLLDEPIKACLLDRFVLRWPSPSVTIGGGAILDLGGTRDWRRDESLRPRLEARRNGSLADFRRTELRRDGFSPRTGFLRDGPFSDQSIAADLQSAESAGEIRRSGDWLFDAAWLRGTSERLLGILTDLHRAEPYQRGLNLAEWQSRLGLTVVPMGEIAKLLETEGAIKRTGDAYHLPGHTPSLPSGWSQEEARLWQSLEAGEWQPPPRSDLETAAEHGREIVAYWQSTTKIVVLGDGVIFSAARFQQVRERVLSYLKENGTMTAAQLRDLFGTTRRYAVPIIEQLDREGITQRNGDVRVLADSAPGR
ncbi:MAG: selenocysteine-specific translation elongation factor [Candidatus Zixiibacteriota bacterium]